MSKEIVDVVFIDPLQKFMNRSTTSGILLFTTAVLAMVIANSPLQHWYHELWQIHFKIGVGEYMIDKDLHHWINDGLMAVFFFVVGLELKREIISGELSNPKNAILPIGAAIGGMIFPALIYLFFNPSGEASNGWGVPMATDIAFVLGLLYILGDRVPISLKVFLTALAIADDIGAVLIIAFFYTSNIEEISLLVAGGFLVMMIIANRIGVRSSLVYAILGIVGLWVAFLLSGIHATIAAVLAALTIPASAKVPETIFARKMQRLLKTFESLDKTKAATLTEDQVVVLSQMKTMSDYAMPPLQKLEHGMHPLVAFIVMPIFAFANAGITIEGEFFELLFAPITLGVILGLLIGKVVGVYLVSFIIIKLKIAKLPEGMNKLHLLGAGLLAAIGFTMSLFIAGLAFNDPISDMQAKIGVLMATLIASVLGFITIKVANARNAKTIE
ncbi:Na+/H+ antiporter NhaA [Weeksellaceae bacterium KMM 9724]|uniref:Na+/H+ antiporter NhaA n=1 Tax=Profundicola chukchiensis TaxID=2961959 RepID=UPI002440A34A|nr:Na+/H+ antiporter NhaA [Profundicola chukchiensis]MDG4950540.1 Na+/H+ antiporter NhaA [Profundicola chukchiensis]